MCSTAIHFDWTGVSSVYALQSATVKNQLNEETANVPEQASNT
jgi:hypothetical protein